MHKKALLVICVIGLLGNNAYAQKKTSRGVKTVGNKVAQPSKADVVGEIEAGDEYKVYSTILQSLFGDDKRQSLVIRRLSSNNTVRDFNDKNIRAVVKSDFPQLDYTTLDDFVSKNQKSYELSTEHFNTESKIVLVSDTDNVTAGAKSCEESWKKFYRVYPTAKGYLIFTMVGFNPDKTQAFVYADYWSNCKKGEGQFYFLQKEGVRWKVSRVQTMWTNRL